MNVLDILILIIAILFGLNGFFRGFIHQLFFGVAVFAGILGGMHLAPYVGKVFSVFTGDTDLLRLLGFALSFVLIATTVSLLGRLVHRGFRLLALGWLDHILGAVFGVGAALFLVAFGVYVLQALLPAESRFVRGSAFAPHARQVAERMLALVPEHLTRRFEEKLREIRAKRLAKAAKQEVVKPLPPAPVGTVSGPKALSTQAALSNGLVDLKSVAPFVKVDLRYATTDNFLHQKLYPTARCFLQRSVAKRLKRVAERLRRRKLGLKVWDCYRPLSVQWKMWQASPRPGYVADPRQGSNHNRGAAVDLTLVDAQGRDLWMPTDFDDFSPRAHHGAQAPKAAQQNRRILRDAMLAEGFVPLPTEWWHYDAPDASRYPVLDIPLHLLP
jgi:D-alanyl-D-alanine dipeptidase